MIDFNTEPYNDDFDEDKKFYRILYRPSFAVQARELTQMQTILQNQIKHHGDAIFKQGAMVIAGNASVETITQPNKGADYIKLQSIYGGVAVETFLSSLDGVNIVGSSGTTAQIIKTQSQENADPTTLYIRYTNSGNDNETKSFSDGEVITTEDEVYSFQVQTTDGVGKGSLATVQRGVYYVNGHFCLVEEQTIVLDKYDNAPTYRVGLNVSESVVTPEQDETLLDNAQNSYNFAAPGAHRYYIDLQLTKKALDDTDDQDFIELIRVDNGTIKTIVDVTKYSQLGAELARRTYDESGNYTVKPFLIDIREHRNNNRGQWEQNTDYLTGDIVTNGGYIYVAKNSGTSVTTAPVHTSGTAYDGPGATGINWEYNQSPYYNRGIYADGDSSKLAIGLEPGKAYVQGWEIEKKSITYLDIPKARDYAQATNSIIPATVGNYVLVNNINNLPPVDVFGIVKLMDGITGASNRGTQQGNIAGYARVRFIEWHTGLPFGTSSVYKLGLFDIQMNSGYDFNRDVKSFYYDVSSDPQLSFTADVEPVLTPLIGSVTASGTTVTGVGTSFQTDLAETDYIKVGSGLYKIATIASQTSLTLATSLTATGQAFSLVTTEVLEPGNNSLIFQLPYYAVRSVRQAGVGGLNDTTYTAYQKFTQNASGTTLNLSTSGTFASAAETDNYICIDNDATAGGAVFTPVSIVPSGSNVTITVPAGQSGHSISVIAAVIRTGGGYEKSKTLTTATPNTFTTAATAQATTLLLEHADVFRIISVKMAPGVAFGGTPTSGQYTLDISDRYEFDNGQRITHYDLARLNLKPSYTVPSNPIQIEYEYFAHGVGDYFDVNSYINIDYSQIPSYLRDCLDFRPRMANKSGGSTRNFEGTGSSTSLMPKRGIDVETDFSYYLGRKDKVALDFNGNFFQIAGVSSLNPGSPEDTALGMVIYNLELEPYTFGTNNQNVLASKVENKRYTMRDIGKLEKRIDNLEYYTSLSLLETETQALKTLDSDGLDRTKLGFVVDNFTGSKIGNSNSADYFCAIDMGNQELRPFYTMNNVNLLEKNSNDAQRTSSNYQLHGDIITLPVIEEPVLVKQEYASRLENINPFAIFTFLGNVSLNPPSDDWFVTDRLPDIVQQAEGNYNVIKSLAEKAGVLGTVWNAWQNEWVGQTLTGSQTYYNSGGASGVKTFNFGGNIVSTIDLGGARAPARQVTVEYSATQIGQSRSGITTSLVTKTDYEQVADRVVSTAVIPYIRSRNILVQAKKLKPNTKFYAYFDNVDILDYITPANKMVYTPGSGTFDIDTNVGGVASESDRRINGDSQVCLNRGDVITNSADTATAVVVGKTYDADNGVYTLDIVNIKGTFSASDNFTGSISGASGTVVSVSTPTDLVTSLNGEVNFLFNIPETDAVRFRTGSRELKLVDTSTATSSDWTSKGVATYRAEGILETKQATINAVRNAELVQEFVTENQTIYQSSARIVSDTGWYDPLAQSFLVQQAGGAFLTKIDIFFASKDTAIPVQLQIREMINGTPGKNILPFSQVTLKPEQVNISSSTVTLDGVDYPSYDTPTTFTFPTPVYVQDNTEYCFVLLSDSNKYKVWISNVGDQIPGTSRTISEQPYAGVMFKSQNASTWTEDQNQDIKFTLYRAKFDTSVIGNVQFVNDVLPYDNIETDPFQTVNGSSTVRVWHYDHGMPSGSRVQIDGVTADVNGIPFAQLNATHIISNVDLNSYTITTASSATSSGYSGGGSVRATKNIQYDLVNPTVQMQTFPETTTSFSIKTTSGKAVDGGQTPYVIDTSFSPCLNIENNSFYSPRMISSEINENNSLAGNKSVTFAVAISTLNDSVSPVIDTARASMILISNKVNSPTESNVNVAALDNKSILTGATGAFTFNAAGTITSTNSAVRTAATAISVGKYVVISGATTSGNNGTFLVTGNTDDGTTTTITFNTTFTGEAAVSGTTLTLRELFADEIAPIGSSSASKYVTVPINLAQTSTYLRVKFAANIPNGSDVQVYYKAYAGEAKQLDRTKYTLMSPDSAINKVENGNSTFFDVDYTLQDMTPFDVFSIKIVMNSTNSSAIPKIKDLRIIACA